MTRIRRTGRDEIYCGRVFDVTVDTFADDDAGGGPIRIEVVRHNGGACVLPFDADGSVVLVRQWRYPLERTSLEIPAGRIEPGDDPEATARRELEEEAGLSAGTVESLGSILPGPGYTTERVHIYLARDLTPSKLEGDEDYEIGLEPRPLATLDALFASGELRDARVIAALFLARDHLAI